MNSFKEAILPLIDILDQVILDTEVSMYSAPGEVKSIKAQEDSYEQFMRSDANLFIAKGDRSNVWIGVLIRILIKLAVHYYNSTNTFDHK